jgi:hypothetical protein
MRDGFRQMQQDKSIAHRVRSYPQHRSNLGGCHVTH